VRAAWLIFALSLTACQHTQQSSLDRLHPCKIDEGPTEAFCGQYRVFEDRSAKTGRQIRLKIVVAPALQRSPQPDPLFIFEGGPGGGAATLAEYRLPIFRRFQLDRDIVLIDQRGTGDSNPLNCEPEDRDEEDFSKIDDYPVERLRTCLARLKADARFYTTAIAMDDIDDVRRFLGYGPINLWGGSYGTRAALVYLKRHVGRGNPTENDASHRALIGWRRYRLSASMRWRPMSWAASHLVRPSMCSLACPYWPARSYWCRSPRDF